MLIQDGADFNIRNSNGAPALTFAATFGHTGIESLLLANDADVNLPASRGKTSMIMPVYRKMKK